MRVAISDEVFQQLSLRSDVALCPNLKSLSWPSPYGWVHAPMFFSPQLVWVNFPYWQKERPAPTLSELTSAINLLPTTHLETFSLGEVFHQEVMPHSALSWFIQRLKTCFMQLSIFCAITDPAWEHLAVLPRLHSLSLSGTLSIEVQRPVPPRLLFPALKDLRVVVDLQSKHWLSLFTLLKSSPLEKVGVLARNGPQDSSPSQIVLAMLKAGLERRVNSLIFVGFSPASLVVVQQLLPFSSLKIFKCSTVCPPNNQCDFPLEDSEIENLAKALSKLETLSLGTCTHGHRSIAIKSMISLSTHCPYLKTLALPCNLTKITDDIWEVSKESWQKQGTQSCVLRNLSSVIMPSKNTEKWRIADTALYNIFPQMGREV